MFALGLHVPLIFFSNGGPGKIHVFDRCHYLMCSFFLFHIHFDPVHVTTLFSRRISSRFMRAAPTCLQAPSELK